MTPEDGATILHSPCNCWGIYLINWWRVSINRIIWLHLECTVVALLCIEQEEEEWVESIKVLKPFHAGWHDGTQQEPCIGESYSTCLACLLLNWQGRGWWDSAGEAEIISAWFWVTSGYLQHLDGIQTKLAVHMSWVHTGAMSLCDGKATKDFWLLSGQSWAIEVAS